MLMRIKTIRVCERRVGAPPWSTPRYRAAAMVGSQRGGLEAHTHGMPAIAGGSGWPPRAQRYFHPQESKTWHNRGVKSLGRYRSSARLDGRHHGSTSSPTRWRWVRGVRRQVATIRAPQRQGQIHEEGFLSPRRCTSAWTALLEVWTPWVPGILAMGSRATSAAPGRGRQACVCPLGYAPAALQRGDVRKGGLCPDGKPP